MEVLCGGRLGGSGDGVKTCERGVNEEDMLRLGMGMKKNLHLNEWILIWIIWRSIYTFSCICHVTKNTLRLFWCYLHPSCFFSLQAICA